MQPKFWLLCVALSITSLAYDWLIIERLRLKKTRDGIVISRMPGYTWVTVVVGVGYVLIAAAIGVAVGITFQGYGAILSLFCYFAFAGWPMALGEVRHTWSRSEEGLRKILNFNQKHSSK
ncbi:MAG: hypothetical protein KA314_04750 [Chloroflexi bacterium]|nr:hypothetical protein [Chloroflexota bacterium]